MINVKDMLVTGHMIEELEKALEPNYFGKITLEIKSGELVLVRKEQTLLPKYKNLKKGKTYAN